MSFDKPLGQVFGAIEIGVLVSSVLYGATCVQTYMYALTRSAENDGRVFKAMVAGVWLLETGHIVCIWMYFYDASVKHAGAAATLESVPWDFDVALIMHGLLAPAVQAFFNYRIYALSKKLWLALPAWILALVRVTITPAIGIIWGVKGMQYFRQYDNYLAFITLITSVVVDIWTASVLIYLLWSKRSVYRSTIDIVNSVIVWTMETGAATALAATLTLIFWASMPNNGIWISVLFVYVRFYSNSMLVSLNSRDRYKRVSRWAPKTSQSIEISRVVEVQMLDMEHASSKHGDTWP